MFVLSERTVAVAAPPSAPPVCKAVRGRKSTQGPIAHVDARSWVPWYAGEVGNYHYGAGHPMKVRSCVVRACVDGGCPRRLCRRASEGTGMGLKAGVWYFGEHVACVCALAAAAPSTHGAQPDRQLRLVP